MLSRKANLTKFTSIAFSETGSTESKQECLTLLQKFVQQFKDKQTSGDDNSSLNAGEDDDDIIINEASDEENNAAKDKADAIVVEIIASMIEPLKKQLDQKSPDTLQSSLNLKEIRPLGLMKLRTVELIASLVKLNKQTITDAVKEQNVLATLIDLVEQHPWNNFLQLKTHQIFEDLMESETCTAATRLEIIKSSGVVPTCIKMGENKMVKFQSQNQMRHGYMGWSIKLSNLIKKKAEADNMASLEGGAEVFTAEWTAYVEGELTSSNTENARNLGGRPTSNETDDEETTNFDVNMDRIMQRFNVFNNIMVTTPTEGENETQNAEPEAEDTGAGTAHIEVDLPRQESLDSNFSDAGFWKVEGCEDNIDDLLADYE